MQNLVKEFIEEYSCSCGIESRYIDVVSEVGELGKEILKGTEYGKKAFKQRERLVLKKWETVSFLYLHSVKRWISMQGKRWIMPSISIGIA